MQEIEIEFLEWVHPRLGVTPVQVEGGKPLVLKAKINLPQRTWVGLTKAQCGVLWKTNMTPFEYYQAIEDKLKEKNT